MNKCCRDWHPRGEWFDEDQGGGLEIVHGGRFLVQLSWALLIGHRVQLRAQSFICVRESWKGASCRRRPGMCLLGHSSRGNRMEKSDTIMSVPRLGFSIL